MPLTGRFDFRKTFSGKLVLILEEDVRALYPLRKGSTRRRWRKATVMDLAATELRPMMDHRSKPNYTYRSARSPRHPLSSRRPLKRKLRAHGSLRTKALATTKLCFSSWISEARVAPLS